MELYISNAGQEPIYAQITRQIKDKILTGELKEGDALPSIRLLAKELRISVITTKRAYEDLEAAGFIATMPGKGSFVAPAEPRAAPRGMPQTGGGLPAERRGRGAARRA